MKYCVVDASEAGMIAVAPVPLVTRKVTKPAVLEADAPTISQPGPAVEAVEVASIPNTKSPGAALVTAQSIATDDEAMTEYEAEMRLQVFAITFVNPVPRHDAVLNLNPLPQPSPILIWVVPKIPKVVGLSILPAFGAELEPNMKEPTAITIAISTTAIYFVFI